MTMNESWGYQHSDNHYKSSQQIIGVFVDYISKEGKLLLDIGPKADGTIPKEQVKILKVLGDGRKNIARQFMVPKQEHPYGPTTLSKDSTLLYLYVRDIPKGGKVAPRGVKIKLTESMQLVMEQG